MSDHRAQTKVCLDPRSGFEPMILGFQEHHFNLPYQIEYCLSFATVQSGTLLFLVALGELLFSEALFDRASENGNSSY